MEREEWMDGLMTKTARVLSHMLDFRAQNHGVISSNLSNIDTPGYKPKELEFDQELKRAVEQSGIRLTKTDGKHLSSGTGTLDNPVFGSHRLLSLGRGNDLDLDREMAKMAQNNLLYEATVKLLSKKFETMKMIIEERRR
jgi:flagellar basal-body rod protein FlgB